MQYRAPQLCTVVGNQGVGKSRLVAEWLRRVFERSSPTVQVYRGRAAPGGGSFALVSKLLRDRFLVTDADAPDAAAAKVRGVLQEVFADLRVAEVVHFLGLYLPVAQRGTPFLRAIDDVRQHADIARTVLKRFLELDAERAPLVLAFDDLHHADDDSMELLAHVGEALGGSPVVLLASARPELFVRHQRWGAGASDHTRIDLGPLAAREAEAMVRQLLARVEHLPPAIVTDAVEMTSGNPFFLEELVRVFVADGILVPQPGADGKWRIDLQRARRVQLPVTVEEAVQVRIGSLSPEERDLLEKGATFGSVFWTGALTCLRRLDRDDPARALADGQRAAIDKILGDLVEREYLLRMPDSTIAGETEYCFRHNLERDLVAKMTAPDRARRHALFGGQWLETRLEGRTEEQLEFLATLYTRGGASRRAAEAWVAAGDSARTRYANDAAVDLYGKGLALLDADDALARVDALHNLGDVMALSGRTREALGCFEEMLRAAWLLDWQAKAGAAHGRIGRCYRTLGEYDKAEHHLGLALDLFNRARDHRGVAGAEDDLGKVSFLRGDYQRALDRHARALDLRRELGDPRSIALALHNLAQVHHASGNHFEAMARFDEALSLRRDIGDRHGVAQSLTEMGAVWRDRGAHDRALAVYKEAIALTREIGDRVTEAQVGTRIGETLQRAGRFTEAAAALKQAVEVSEAMGDRQVQTEAARLLGETLLEMGEEDAARRQCAAALELAERIGSRAHQGKAHRALGAVLARDPAARADADGHFRSAIEQLGDIGADPELMRAYRAYGDFLEETGDADGAQTVRERADEILGRLRESARVSVDVEVDL